jgi:hypothetical protein
MSRFQLNYVFQSNASQPAKERIPMPRQPNISAALWNRRLRNMSHGASQSARVIPLRHHCREPDSRNCHSAKRIAGSQRSLRKRGLYVRFSHRLKTLGLRRLKLENPQTHETTATAMLAPPTIQQMYSSQRRTGRGRELRRVPGRPFKLSSCTIFLLRTKNEPLVSRTFDVQDTKARKRTMLEALCAEAPQSPTEESLSIQKEEANWRSSDAGIASSSPGHDLNYDRYLVIFGMPSCRFVG